MHDYDFYEVNYQNCEIYGLSVWGSDPRMEPIWLYVKMLKFFENLLFYTHIYLYFKFEKK